MTKVGQNEHVLLFSSNFIFKKKVFIKWIEKLYLSDVTHSASYFCFSLFFFPLGYLELLKSTKLFAERFSI